MWSPQIVWNSLPHQLSNSRFSRCSAGDHRKLTLTFLPSAFHKPWLLWVAMRVHLPKPLRQGLASSLICLAALLHCPQIAFSQSDNATISGLVSDASGAPVKGAAISVRSEATGTERKATSNDSGFYTVPGVPAGTYTISAQFPGFRTLIQSGNRVDAAVPFTANLSLSVGDVTQQMDVTAEATVVQADSATLGRVVTNNQASNLPLNGRDPIYLGLLQAGVTSASSTISTFQFANGQGALNINGGRDRDNLISYDGAVAVRVRANGDTIGVPDLDAVQEVQILTANYPAEYGRSVGGQIRIITKSGTDHLHGTAYDYFRNSALDANSWSRNTSSLTNFVAPFRYNQFGYDVNGPLWIPKVLPKNKVFFLFSQQYVRYRQVDTSYATVPTAAFKAGDFSQLLAGNNIFSKTKQYIKNPASTLPCSQTTGGAGCFAGNIIPQSQLNATGVGLLSAYPNNTPGFQLGSYNWLSTASEPINQRIDTGSVDINPAQDHYIRVRLQNYLWHDFQPFGSSSAVTSTGAFNLVPRDFDRPNQTGSVDYVWTVNPTTTNELLFTASHDHYTIGIGDGTLYDRTQYGINYPYLFPVGKDVPNKIPTIQISSDGISTLDGSPYPSHAGGEIFDLSDTFSKTFGNHTFKAGFLFERSGENDYDQIPFSSSTPGQTNNQNGGFQFTNSNPGGTGLALADTALGLFNSYAEVGQRSQTPYRGNSYEAFAQDSWKVNPKLHLEYGLRYTVIQPYYSLWNNAAVFDQALYNPATAVKVNPSTGNPIPGTGNPYDGVYLLGNGWPSSAAGHVPIEASGAFNNLFDGLPRSYSKTHFTGFQPRVGLAYAFDNKTVLRAGVGRYLARQGVTDGVFVGGNPPLQSVASVASGNANNPGGSGTTGSYPLTTGTIDQNSPYPESWTWNATFEREVGFGTVIDVSYVGRRGLHSQLERNINQPAAGAVQANPGVNINALRPYLGFGPILEVTQDDPSRYDGLQINVNRRFSHDLSFGFAYTFASSTDCGSSQKSILPDANDWRSICGPSDYDVRNAAVVNFVYQLPFFKNSGLTRKLLGGWTLTQADQFQSGTPLSVYSSTDYAGVGTGSGVQLLNVTPSANLSSPHQFAGASAGSQYWFAVTNPDGTPTFTPPAPGTFTTQQNRNIIRNPGIMSWNASLLKDFALTETQRVTFRAEAFDFINHPNLAAVDTVYTDANFGKITSKTGQRNLQLSLRYTF